MAEISGGLNRFFSPFTSTSTWATPIRGFDHFVGHAFGFLFDFAELASHEAFNRVNGIAGVGDRLRLARVAHHAFPVLGESPRRTV
jgi:hypothetical protein